MKGLKRLSCFQGRKIKNNILKTIATETNQLNQFSVEIIPYLESQVNLARICVNRPSELGPRYKKIQ